MGRCVILILSFISLTYSSSFAQTIGLINQKSGVYDGLTLFSPNQQTYLINNCGQVINEWSSDFRPGLSAYLQPNGNLLRAGMSAENIAGRGGVIEEYDWDGNLLWSVNMADSTGLQHHDIEPLPNGNVLAIAWEIKTPEEAEAAGVANVELTGIWPLVIFEYQPDGNGAADIVWEWHAWDHLVQDHDDTKNNFGVIADHPELFDVNFFSPGVSGDWLHANSIDYNADRNEILVSLRNHNEIIIIDHTTSSIEAAGHTGGESGKGGDILYRWGNPQTYGQGDETNQAFFRQHDARWIPNGFPDEGKISIFNNGVGRDGGDISSIDIISPPLDAMGGYVKGEVAFGPDDIEWCYKDEDLDDPFFSQIMGGGHRLPNGNFLITESIDGRIFEITPNNERVWEYINPTNNNGPLSQGSTNFIPFFRARKYSLDYSAFDGRDLSPGERIEMDPLPLNCEFSTSIFTNQVELKDVDIHNNPTKRDVIVRNSSNRELHVDIFNALGQLVDRALIKSDYEVLDIHHLKVGVYIFKLSDHKINASISLRIVKVD